VLAALLIAADLTGPPTAGPQYDRRSRRRGFSKEQKLAIVMESEAPGVSVAAVCWRHDISTSMVFRWRIQFDFGAEQPARLVSVAVVKAEKTSGAGVNGGALVLQDLLQVPDGMAATAGAVPSASIRNQLALALEDLDSDIGRAEASGPHVDVEIADKRPRRKPLADHLPREEVVIDLANDACLCCGGVLHSIGESVSEMLD